MNCANWRMTLLLLLPGIGWYIWFRRCSHMEDGRMYGYIEGGMHGGWVLEMRNGMRECIDGHVWVWKRRGSHCRNNPTSAATCDGICWRVLVYALSSLRMRQPYILFPISSFDLLVNSYCTHSQAFPYPLLAVPTLPALRRTNSRLDISFFVPLPATPSDRYMDR